MTGWLAALPPDWQVADPRRHFRERREAAVNGDVHLTPSQHHGVLSQADYMAKTGTQVVLNLSAPDNMKRVRPGDLIAHLRSFQGGLEKSDLAGKVSTAYTVIEPLATADPGFFRWVLKSPPYIQTLASSLEQLRDGQSVKFGDFAAIPLPLPPIDEQRRIADFLDDRVARIDQIITARQRQRLLTLAAFRGSLSEGVECAARAYGVAPMRRFCAQIEQGSSPVAEDRSPEEGEAGILKTSAVHFGQFLPGNAKAISRGVADERHRVRDGDVLVVRGSGSAELVGDAATVRLPADAHLYLSDLTYRLRGLTIDPEFATLSLISARARSELAARVRQGSGPAKARGEDILSLPAPRAPLDVQVQVVGEASALRSNRDRSVALLQASIHLMQEYKQSLITAAVTGELDVTTAGSGIPG